MSDIELMPRARPKIAIPIGSPMAMSDPNARSRMTTAATKPATSPTPVSASSKAKNRSPPISICSGEPSRAWTPNSLRFSRSPGFRSSSTGYCRRMRATRPSGEIVPHCTACSGPAASAPAGSVVSSTWGRARAPASTWVRAACASAESKNVAWSSSGVMTTCAVSPARPECAAVSRSVASWESSPGTSKESSSFWPKALDAPMTSKDTTSHDPMTAHGRRAANRPNR